MSRPKNPRRICFRPEAVYFKPRGVPMSSLDEVVVGADELEAIRLSDVEGLDQTAAAGRMGVSQPTFARILSSARKKLAGAVVRGMAIRLEGTESRHP